MTEFIGTETLVEGFGGLPVETHPEHGPARGSVEWLLDAVERHALAEEESLEQYRYISQASGDPVVSLVMRLILEDEQRHHGLLKRMEASLRDALDWSHSSNALPASAAPQVPVAPNLAEAVAYLIDEEHTGARYMRQIASAEASISAGLHTLLLEMMAMDSEKHARLLQFVRDRLAARARADAGQSS
jgi:rubrerythrin